MHNKPKLSNHVSIVYGLGYFVLNSGLSNDKLATYNKTSLQATKVHEYAVCIQIN